MKDFTIELEDKPGSLADIAEALGSEGINIEGGCGITCEGKGILHLLVENTTGAKSVFERTGAKIIEERDVLVLDVEDKPGALGSITRKLANASVNINLMYLTAEVKLVLGVDDLNKAKEIL